jgi:hypothetical protein
MKRLAISAVASMATLLLDISPAEAQRRTQVGRLRCTLAPSVSHVLMVWGHCRCRQRRC